MRPLGQGSDAAVSLAVLIATQRAEHGISVGVSRRALDVSHAWFRKWRKEDRSVLAALRRTFERKGLGDLSSRLAINA
jgi:putative transposase